MRWVLRLEQGVPMSMRRTAKLLAAVAALSVAAVLAAPGVGAGSNRLPNPSFEQSPIDPVGDRIAQPVLPTGWAFEGAAGLFDHAQRGGSHGARFAAISIPAGGKRALCGPEVGCTPLPTTEVKETATAAYSVNPAWRNAAPVPVTPGAAYTVAADVSWDIVTEGEGAFATVRWISSAGTVLSSRRVWTVRATATTSVYRPWGRVSGTVAAPAGATGAIVLFGATDDIWISQIKFDSVFFG